MAERNRAMIIVFLLCVNAEKRAAESYTLDVCASCHANATCDDKSDGSGKVCNCKYGFVGNGRTFCQDKDECQIGANKICGQHTTCHNTYGSYYCTCLAGYSPSNNMAIFIPNDGTHCQDIDECRITGLCGEGGQCRNLEGSFDCSCQLGYQVHNGAEPFHPHRDKASCKVVDCGPPASVEDTVLLSVTGTTYSSVAMFVCDEGFVWRRGDNRSVCGADGLWRGPTMVCEEVDCGSPPALPHSHMLWNKRSSMGTVVLYQCNSGYHNVGKGNVSICTAAGQWERPSVLCQETLCGNPPVIESTEQVWDSNSTPGSTVLYVCKEGFYNQGGDNVSICNENAQWTPPTLSCQEILCGDPPLLPHTGQVWNGSSTPGSTVTYYCEIGFYHNEGNNISLCTVNGYWTKPNISCKGNNLLQMTLMPWLALFSISGVQSQIITDFTQLNIAISILLEVHCGVPQPIPHSIMLWDKISTVGSQVVYQCNSGYRNVGEGNVSVCTSSGEWDEASLLCQEINCQEPVFKPHAKMLWDGTSHIGSVVYYQCEEGYNTRSLRNYSVCGENGLWEDIDLWCEEISCGPPLTLPDTNLLWDRTSRPGSVVLYECMDGFYQESGNNISTCLLSGQWGEVSVKCKAKCGPVPFLAKSEVVWHNRSVVIHRCVDGYHSWRGSNVSVCSSFGVWQRATLRCIEIKPAVNHLFVLNEKCLHWRAEKYEEDTEVYKVTYIGSRDYQRSFHDRRKQFLSSKADQLELCLNLLPVTNYSISITAVSSRFTATITTNTSLPVPPAPVVDYREFETPIPTLRLRRSPNTLDPISLYQVFVLPVEGIMMFDCSSPASSDPSGKIQSFTEYITAQIDVTHVGTEMNFTVGDGLYYGGFFNAPLENGRNYYITLRAVSQWKSALKSSCVLWAKVRGTSYVLRVSSLSAAATIGLVAFIILVGYSFTWYRRWYNSAYYPPC
ncbi:sushi domain-containing protein 1 isoform X5 [Sander lucioperca]|uniref:sushi domain-containing protein 1 isoform X5 n=1 Tax=Sander lucioperca TaxID=283035 RepID=UPI0016535EBD|nr:sushi domain-containing protein 1 isoform X5 [Sander lucioperca]